MLVAADKIAIFYSIPKLVTVIPTLYTVKVDYADRVVVTDLLKTDPLVVTLRYYNDRPDKLATPSNLIMKKDISERDIVYTIGEKRQVTLSVNIYAVDTKTLPADEIISAYLALFLPWTINGLMDLVDVADRSGVSDLTFLESNIARRQMDISIRHEIGSSKTFGTIETITAPDVTFT